MPRLQRLLCVCHPQPHTLPMPEGGAGVVTAPSWDRRVKSVTWAGADLCPAFGWQLPEVRHRGQRVPRVL